MVMSFLESVQRNMHIMEVSVLDQFPVWTHLGCCWPLVAALGNQQRGQKREEENKQTKKKPRERERERFLILEPTLVAVAWNPSCKPWHTCQHARGSIRACACSQNVLHLTHNTRKIYVLSWVNTLSCNPHPRLSHKSKQALGQNLLPVERAVDLWDADAYMDLESTCFQACPSSPPLQTQPSRSGTRSSASSSGVTSQRQTLAGLSGSQRANKPIITDA